MSCENVIWYGCSKSRMRKQKEKETHKTNLQAPARLDKYVLIFCFLLLSGPSYPPSRASLFELWDVGGCRPRWVAQSQSLSVPYAADRDGISDIPQPHVSSLFYQLKVSCNLPLNNLPELLLYEKKYIHVTDKCNNWKVVVAMSRISPKGLTSMRIF